MDRLEMRSALAKPFRQPRARSLGRLNLNEGIQVGESLLYRLRARLTLTLSQFPGEVVEHAQLIAVQIGDPELAELPGFIVRFVKDLRPGASPTIVQLIDFVFAV